MKFKIYFYSKRSMVHRFHLCLHPLDLKQINNNLLKTCKKDFFFVFPLYFMFVLSINGLWKVSSVQHSTLSLILHYEKKIKNKISSRRSLVETAQL